MPPLGHTREFEEGLAMTADAKALARLLFDLRVAHCVTDGLKIEIGPRQKIRTQGKGHVSVQK